MSHLGYIVAAYSAAFVVIGGMVAFVLADLRTQKRRLNALDALRRGGKGG